MIVKTGEVKITEKEVLVSGFEFLGETVPVSQYDALLWAKGILDFQVLRAAVNLLDIGKGKK